MTYTVVTMPPPKIKSLGVSKEARRTSRGFRSDKKVSWIHQLAFTMHPVRESFCHVSNQSPIACVCVDLASPDCDRATWEMRRTYPILPTISYECVWVAEDAGAMRVKD